VTDIGTGSTDVESTGDGGTAEQVKDQVREKAQVAQDKASRPSSPAGSNPKPIEASINGPLDAAPRWPQ
jgi:hypothetical protein